MNDILDVHEAAAFLKFKNTHSLYNLVNHKKIRAYKPNGGRIYFKRSDIERYAFSNPTIDLHEEAEKILNRPRRKKEKQNG